MRRIAYPFRARSSGGCHRRGQAPRAPDRRLRRADHREERSRLAFDIQSQTSPLHELRPYKKVHAEHLLDTLRSRHGEFRLTALPGGRARLEGRTF